jgi:ribose transport system permease protein
MDKATHAPGGLVARDEAPLGEPVTAPARAVPPPAPESAARRAPARTSFLGRPSRGLVTILVATAALFLASEFAQPESLSRSSIQGMLPFAAVLAIIALGQTLVVQQGGIDLSVPGTVSLGVVIVTHYPNGVDSRLPLAVLGALGAGLAAGLLNGLLVSRLRMSPIVASLGANALLYAAVIGISHGSPTSTTSLMAKIAVGHTLGLPRAVWYAAVLTAVVAVIVKGTVAGRRFEAVGDNPIAAYAAGLRVRRHQLAAYVFASLLYAAAGVLLGGVVTTPSSFQGDPLLLPSVAAVVLGGTSLLGGKGSVVGSAIAALFLNQLDQVVLTSGVGSAAANIVQALALAFGVGVYTLRWDALRRRIRIRRGRRVAATTASS